MKIIWNYVFILTGLAIFLQLAGVQIAGLSQLFGILGITANSSGITYSNTSTILTVVLGILATATIVGAILGFFTRASPENYVVVPFGSLVIVFYIAFVYSIISYAGTGTFGIIVGAILIPLTIGLIYGLLDWFRGGDF